MRIPIFLAPEKPRLLSQTKGTIIISYTSLNNTRWDYLYNATIAGSDNGTCERACDNSTNTCTFHGLSSTEEYVVQMQVFIPSFQSNPPLGSELSEALFVFPLNESEIIYILIDLVGTL